MNNLNEIRKQDVEAIQIYENLLNTLRKDSIDLVNIIALQERSAVIQLELIKSKGESINGLKDSKALHQRLFQIISGAFSYFPRYGTYNRIIANNGMDLLESERIKSLLINLYDSECKRYENVDAIVDEKFQNDLIPIITVDMGVIFDIMPSLHIVKEAQVEEIEVHLAALAMECRGVYPILSNSRLELDRIQHSVNELIELIKIELEP